MLGERICGDCYPIPFIASKYLYDVRDAWLTACTYSLLGLLVKLDRLVLEILESALSIDVDSVFSDVSHVEFLLEHLRHLRSRE